MKVHCYGSRPPRGINMADQNPTVSPETVGEVITDFGEICRFCLSETKSDLSINDKCLWEEATGSEEESIYNFLTRLNFIKMNNSDSFPLQVCENCFKLVQLFHDFGQLCQISDNLLKTCYENSLKETETKSKISLKEPYCQELLDYEGEELPKATNNFSAVLEEINKVKTTFSGQKLTNSVTVLKAYKQKLTLLSERIKKAQSKLSNSASREELVSVPAKGQSTLSCAQCSLKFRSSKDLRLHVLTHNQKRLRNAFKFQCKDCLKFFSCEEKLKRHYKVIHKISELPDDCVNNKQKQLIQTESKKFFCFHCTPCAEFQSQDRLTEHLNAFHDNDASKVSDFSCSQCSYSNFPSRINLNQHLLLVHKLGEDKSTQNEPTVSRDPEPPKVFLCVNPKQPPQCEKQSQNLTELSAFLGVLDSVVGSLNVIQGETGFRVLCKNCKPQPEFTSPNEFVSHIQTHHGEAKVFQNWGNDEKTATKDGPWSCTECPASYSRKQSLYYHLKEKHKHSNVGGMKCPDCPERFATNRQLIQHGINTHQKYFAYFHNVYKKILQPESEEEEESKAKNFECDMCHKRYIYKTSLKKHILVAHLGQVPNDSVVCSYCGKTLSSKLNLKSHIEFVHEALFVSCPICKKRINFRTIGKHYKTHKNSDVVHSKNSFLCNLCGKVLKSKRSFEDHQKLHKNIRDELCDVCGSGFTTKKCLRLHKKNHEGVQRKVFGCDQCDKVFSGRHTLNRHLLTHSGKKNFICEICSKCFYTLQELNRHVRCHRKEYRFDCQLCDMKFLDKSRFRHHMMRHRNVRPHKCQFCDKMFIVKGKMNVHMAAKHNIEMQNTKAVWKDPKTYVPLDDLL